MLCCALGGCLILLSGCQQKQPDAHASTPASPLAPEVSIRTLPLGPPLDAADMEVSGLAWHGDTLVVLPQYPSRAASPGTARLYGIPRVAIERALASDAPDAISPVPISVRTTGLGQHVPEYEGCEAIAFAGGRMYVLVEARREGAMHSVVLTGEASSLDTLVVRAGTPHDIPMQATLQNMAYEAAVVWQDTVFAFFEANGANVNATPQAYRFNRDAEPVDALPFPTLEYRLTDATTMDAEGRFWGTNYFYPGERDILHPATDSVRVRHAAGTTHRASDVVERLVEFQYTGTRIVRTDTPPLWLTLGGGTGRNWEGVARFGNGFLIATDQYPRTMLAYVEHPAL